MSSHLMLWTWSFGSFANSYVLIGAKMLLRRCFFAEQRFSLLPTCFLLRIIKENNIILTNKQQEKLSLLSQDLKNPDLLTFTSHQNQKKQAEREKRLRYCFWCLMDIYRRLLQWKPLHCSSANLDREKVGKMTMINANCF